MRQAYLAYKEQDIKTPEDLNTIEGEIKVSIVEVGGLILPREKNRNERSEDCKLWPVVKIAEACYVGAGSRTQQIGGLAQRTFTDQERRRDIRWGQGPDEVKADFVVNLRRVNYSRG